MENWRAEVTQLKDGSWGGSSFVTSGLHQSENLQKLAWDGRERPGDESNVSRGSPVVKKEKK